MDNKTNIILQLCERLCINVTLKNQMKLLELLGACTTDTIMTFREVENENIVLKRENQISENCYYIPSDTSNDIIIIRNNGFRVFSFTRLPY